jgi:hypothetical protein
VLLSIYFCRDNSGHHPSLQLPLAALRTRAKKGTRSASKLNIVRLYFSLPPLEKVLSDHVIPYFNKPFN